MIGKTPGHYHVLEKIGQGGMGEVYRAEDTSLSRHVAIKVLPDEFSQDPERLARFEREAKVLASLNHPNIAAIYGLEQADGKRFLVLELVEGRTLAQRLLKGPLPVEEALEVCRQMAEGLEAAHEKGVIHRDLKPANIQLTPDDKVKILDFGLARAFHEQPSEVELTNPTTVAEAMTRAGTILGTAAYMSPEQAKGKPVDKRTDIWAFGCVLYECLTGKRAFEGETVTETLAAIIKGEPDWKSLPQGAHARVREILLRCLQKDPKRRYHDIGDVRLDMELPIVGPTDRTAAPWRLSLPWPVVGAIVMLLAGILIGRALTSRSQILSSASLVTSMIKVEPGYWLDGKRSDYEIQRPSRNAMAISRDGRFVVYSAIEENPGPKARPRLFLRRLDQSEAKAINGTEGGINPFLSPDDLWIGFWADDKLKKVPIGGGVPTTLCGTSSWLYGASWGGNNRIVFTDGWGTGLSIVSADGGDPKRLSNPDPKRGEGSHRLPSWLPDGRTVLFTIMRHAFDRQPSLALFRLDTREWQLLLADGADARYVPTGHLVFLRQGTLMAVPFDPAELKTIGQPSPLLENVSQSFSDNGTIHSCAGQFAISDSGHLIYATGGVVPDEKRSLVWVDKNLKEQTVTTLQVPFSTPRLSHDGQRITYATEGREPRVWVYETGRDRNSAVSAAGKPKFTIWSGDSKRIIFAWFESAGSNLFSQPFDGSVQMTRLTTSEDAQVPGSLRSDGQTLAFVEVHQDANYDIALLDISTRRVTPLINSPYIEMCAEFSPDGRWIAYASNRSGRVEVYVQGFPNLGTLYQVSSGGGFEPAWARDGKQMFYRWGEEIGNKMPSQMWVVDVRTDSGFTTSKPRLVFERSGYNYSAPGRDYDLSLDSQRFLMVRNEERKPAPVTEMILVQNWFEELRRLLPTGK